MDHLGALGAGGGIAFGLCCPEDAEAAGFPESGTAIFGFGSGARSRHLGMAANFFPSGQRLSNFNEVFELATCHLFFAVRGICVPEHMPNPRAIEPLPHDLT